MYCPECGKYNHENDRFCRSCGARLEDNAGGQTSPGAGYGYAGEPEQFYTEQTNASYGNTSNGSPKKKGKKKVLLIVAAILILAAAAAAAVFLWIIPQQKEKDYQAYLSDGDRYLEELDYEKAEDSYLAAIEVEPKEPEPYLKLADMYAGRNEPEKAVHILKQGAEKTDSPEIRERYDLYTYVESVLIPEEGQCAEGEYTCKYINIDNGSYVRPCLDPVHSEKGVLSSRIRDFDSDGKEELLVLLLNNTARENEYAGADQNEVILRMYEAQGGKVALSDEVSALCPVLGQGDSESSGIFLHENAGQTYICGSFRQHIYMYADGITFYSFIMTYDGNKFQKQAGTDEAISGSEFSSEESAAENMADYLEEIGLDGEARQIRDSWVRCFEFADDVEMLMLVEGENDDSGDGLIYYETRDPADLGKVILTLKLSWDDGKDEADGEDAKDGQGADGSKNAEEQAEAAEDAYSDMLDSGDYSAYTSEWMAQAESYSILDIDQDKIPELMVHSANDGFGWSNTLLFAYDRDSQEIKLVEDIYHYADIRYSDKHKAIVYSDVRSTQMYGGQGFFTLDGTTLTAAFSVGWDNTSGVENYFIYENGSQKEISESESDAYYSELTEIERTEL